MSNLRRFKTWIVLRLKKVIENRIEKCKQLLGVKAGEYAAGGDRLYNFKVAAILEDCTPEKSLAGMMAKHTVSVYDLINRFEEGEYIPKSLWEEKIGDHINYLLLLTALIEEREGEITEIDEGVNIE